VIVGGSIGAIVAIAAAAGLVVFLIIRRKRLNKQPKEGDTEYGNLGSGAELLPTSYTRVEAKKKKPSKGSRPAPQQRRKQRESPNSSDEDVEGDVSDKVRADLEKEFLPEWLIPYSDLKFQKKLGQGAFGVVFLGKWRTAKVAIKQSTVLAVDQDALEDFKQEALLMLSLQPHPNCVQVLGICVHDTNVYMILELCPLGSLESLMKSGLTMERKLNIIAGFTAGVAHLHENGIIHRDLAARNILIGDGDVSKVRYVLFVDEFDILLIWAHLLQSDFGMARMVDTFERKGTTVSHVGPIRVRSLTKSITQQRMID
jgi:serine/threonine protein kinase